MSFVPFLMLQLVIFAGLVVALRRILSRNVTDATAHLQILSAEYTRRHEELKQQLAEAERQYQEQIAKAKLESEQLVTQARQEAESSRLRLLEQARSESERIMQQALDSSNGLKQEAEQAMMRMAVDRACELIHEVLPGQLRSDIQQRLVDELLRDGLVPSEQLTVDPAVTEVKVVSAFPLSPAQQQMLRQRIQGLAGRELALSEEVDERLVAGLTIMLGSMVLDGSLAFKIREAARLAQRNT